MHITLVVPEPEPAQRHTNPRTFLCQYTFDFAATALDLDFHFLGDLSYYQGYRFAHLDRSRIPLARLGLRSVNPPRYPRTIEGALSLIRRL